MIFFIASRMDVAGSNIASQLATNYGFDETSESFGGSPVYSMKLGTGEVAKLGFIDQEPVDTQCLALPSLRLLVFLSRHKSESETPTLSVHTPGNLGEATLGGLPRTVSVSPASAMKEALTALKKAQEEMNLDYEVSYECTHHGPSLNVPTMFVELGSSPKQWGDVEAAGAVAKGAMAAASNERIYPAVLGIGGPHYNKKFTKAALRTDTAFGHMIPKYALPRLNAEVLKQCIARTVEPVEKAVLDWKGIKGADKAKLLDLIKETSLEIERI